MIFKDIIVKFSAHGAERCAHAPCSLATEEPEWTVGVRRAVSGRNLVKPPSLLHQLLCRTMSKPKFQTEWEEIDQEYQQLQVSNLPKVMCRVFGWSLSPLTGATLGG